MVCRRTLKVGCKSTLILTSKAFLFLFFPPGHKIGLASNAFAWYPSLVLVFPKNFLHFLAKSLEGK